MLSVIAQEKLTVEMESAIVANFEEAPTALKMQQWKQIYVQMNPVQCWFTEANNSSADCNKELWKKFLQEWQNWNLL